MYESAGRSVLAWYFHGVSGGGDVAVTHTVGYIPNRHPEYLSTVLLFMGPRDTV